MSGPTKQIKTEYSKIMKGIEERDEVEAMAQRFRPPKRKLSPAVIKKFIGLVIASIVFGWMSTPEEIMTEGQYREMLKKKYPDNIALVEASNEFVSNTSAPLDQVIPNLNKALKQDPKEPDQFDPKRFLTIGKTSVYPDTK